ncbi:hypothetical protein IW262DRAFT_496185 [Armillaria fumosa]|nr:hypothetical protein IW262DRAFT_496185 [Armillaria fumosa]
MWVKWLLTYVTFLDIISQALSRLVDTFLGEQPLSDVYFEGIWTSHIGVPLKQSTRFTGDISCVEDYISLFKNSCGTLDAVSDKALALRISSTVPYDMLGSRDSLFLHRHSLSEAYLSSNTTVFWDRRQERQSRT